MMNIWLNNAYMLNSILIRATNRDKKCIHQFYTLYVIADSNIVNKTIQLKMRRLRFDCAVDQSNKKRN